jgi:hypothetical protein
MLDLILFISIPVIAAIIGFSIYLKRTDSNRQSKRGIISDVVLAVGVALAIAIASVVVNKASASDFKYLNSAYVWAGMEHDLRNRDGFCYVDEAQWAGNLGVRVNLVEYNRFTLSAHYIHHSCAFTSDRTGSVYDAVGAHVTWKLW